MYAAELAESEPHPQTGGVASVMLVRGTRCEMRKLRSLEQRKLMYELQ